MSSSADAELARLWEEFERDGDDPANLLAFASRYPQSGTACGHRYPFLHRIGDAPSGGPGTGLRLLRCTKCEARLFLVPCTALSPQAGVPLWLRGVLLARWTEDEDRSPWKDPLDWTHYARTGERRTPPMPPPAGE